MMKIGENAVENTVFFSEKTGLQILHIYYNIIYYKGLSRGLQLTVDEKSFC